MFTMKDYLVESERRKSEIAAAEAERLRESVAQQEALRSTRLWTRLAAHLAVRPRSIQSPPGQIQGAAGKALS
jgi:hypothetical protein